MKFLEKLKIQIQSNEKLNSVLKTTQNFVSEFDFEEWRGIAVAKSSDYLVKLLDANEQATKYLRANLGLLKKQKNVFEISARTITSNQDPPVSELTQKSDLKK